MIKIEENHVTVEFAKEVNNATISLKTEENGILLKPIKKEGLVIYDGDYGEDYIDESKSVKLVFNTIESIDVVISALVNVRFNLKRMKNDESNS